MGTKWPSFLAEVAVKAFGDLATLIGGASKAVLSRGRRFGRKRFEARHKKGRQKLCRAGKIWGRTFCGRFIVKGPKSGLIFWVRAFTKSVLFAAEIITFQWYTQFCLTFLHFESFERKKTRILASMSIFYMGHNFFASGRFRSWQHCTVVRSRSCCYAVPFYWGDGLWKKFYFKRS
jgi:hypothetical protein